MPGLGKSHPMKTTRRQDDGGPEKMSPFEKINTEFGVWTSTPSIMMRNEQQDYDYVIPGGAAPSPSPALLASPATTTRKACKTFSPSVHGTPRYSKIDKFIEGLDAACEALPTPLMGCASAPPPPRATVKECAFTTQDRHPHHRRKSHQEDCRLLPMGIVKEVKFADKVIEIGNPEVLMSLEKSVPDVVEPTKQTTASDSGGARVSRAVRFDYRKRRSDFVKAATVVQSTYRGYKVRRGQPLKYLLAISSVKEKLEELRQQFDAWKIAAWFPTDLTERATMTESVMDLLLQLDSLQGVPVVVREFRKNVARDVIKFQEEVDGFLCRNSKHGVLFDLTRSESKVSQGSNNLKPSKPIRNIVVHEPKFTENRHDCNPKTCKIRHNGSNMEVKGGTNRTMTSSEVTSEVGGDQSRTLEDPSSSVHSHGCSRQNFVLWSPMDAQFEKVKVEEKNSEAKELESVTELKKCIVSTGNVDTYVPPDRKKKSLGVRFGIANFGNSSLGKEHLSTIDECPHPPPGDASPCNSAYVKSWRKDMQPHASSWEFTEKYEQKDDSKYMVSINKQRSLEIPKDSRIANEYENLVEDHEMRHPQPLPKPDYSSKWEAKFPVHLHRDNLFDTDKSCTTMERSLALVFEPTHGTDEDLHTPMEGVNRNDHCGDHFSCNQTKLEAFQSRVEYSSTQDVKEGTIEHESSISTNNTPALMFEPELGKDEDLRTLEKVVTSDGLHDEDFTGNQTKLQTFPSRVKYISAKDVREGTIEPLIASDQKDDKVNSLVTASGFERCSKDTFGYFDADDYTDSLARVDEGNKMGISQDMPSGLDLPEGDPSSVAVFATVVEQVQKPAIPGSEPIEVGQPTLLDSNSEKASMLIPSTSMPSDNIREQLDGEPGGEYEPCRFDDLETISSCSNCAAYPADCMGGPWDFESGIREQMPHQPYALKGLVQELDEVFSERKGEDTRSFEDGHWKDEVWKDYTTTEFQPFHVATIGSQPTFEREVEVEREDESCKSFKTFESDRGQCVKAIAQNLPVETKLASTLKEQYPDIRESTCPESQRSPLASTSQSLGGGVATGIIALPSHGDEKKLLLSKLLEDNKRLKELLKEVMKWNTVQANAMITLNERLELVESKK